MKTHAVTKKLVMSDKNHCHPNCEFLFYNDMCGLCFAPLTFDKEASLNYRDDNCIDEFDYDMGE